MDRRLLHQEMMVSQLVVFGAAGDLMSRYLAPALFELERRGDLPEGLTVVGVGRDAWSDDRFREHLASELPEPGADGEDATERERLLARVRYAKADATSADAVRELFADADGPVVAYLALPPAVAGDAVEALGRAGLPEGSRIVLEKPFGDDVESARALDERISSWFSDDDVFRVDHFLGLRAVRNLLALRFANPVLARCWDARSIERIEIIWDETLGLEGRAGYYDGVGALKDMVQNHLLQVLCLVAMEPPEELESCAIRTRRHEVLRAITKLAPADAARRSVRARYLAGQLSGEPVPAYVDEDGVDPEHQTETFVELVLEVNTPRWRGVPFVLRTGKALAAPRKEIVVVFRTESADGPDLFAAPRPARLRIGLDPECVHLELPVIADEIAELVSATPAAALPEEPLPAYARVLRSIIHGEPATTVGGAEAIEAWRVVEPFLEAWRRDLAPMLEYPAGSNGPPVSWLHATSASPRPNRRNGKRARPEARSR